MQIKAFPGIHSGLSEGRAGGMRAALALRRFFPAKSGMRRSVGHFKHVKTLSGETRRIVPEGIWLKSPASSSIRP